MNFLSSDESSISFVACLVLGFCISVKAQEAKLEGHVVDSSDRSVSGVRIVSPGGQAAVTDNRGHFRVNFPSSIQPGQATRIEIIREGWVIYEPMLGNCVTQSAIRNYQPLKIIIVPTGSPLALSPKRLSQVIAKWSDERSKLRSQVGELKSQLDEYAFLQEYAEKYGFTLERFVREAKQWAKSAESDDKYERALKEYFLKNYDRAATLAGESALVAKRELEQFIRSIRIVLSVIVTSTITLWTEFLVGKASQQRFHFPRLTCA